ncbi:NAD(P)H-binding protein [Actinokineospora terrae]|uniref:Saccharopine dehydrogenase NADP binding domain-containing protein n=1 Tax=Actinokineospora terrae TaxID=155974 RepID=A0A1H9LL70_9PSEU|nr:NAD(P)H-binding protein [Actinokineospora terrae]SER11957.1 Saccharopine dehydrogenase NADP binding domain-containing protein [Actinokineospora terrae]
MQVAVYGAYGHTGRFVVAELRERGYDPIPSGRDPAKLATLGPHTRQAAIDDLAALDRALDGAAAVINCAGPFALTARPVMEAAERAGIPYLDIAAEIEANVDTFAQVTTTTVVPAMAFFGGLGDLLATAAMADWTSADEVDVAYGLTGWHPTPGTLTAGAISRQRRDGRRVRHTGGRLEYHDDTPSTRLWPFPAGPREVISEFSMADIVTIPSHLAIPEVRTHMATTAAQDLSAAQERTTAESFVVDVRVRKGRQERRIVASGQDIYAVSAPLVVEAAHRVLTGQTKTTGVAAPGKIFDALDFLRALSPRITLE